MRLRVYKQLTDYLLEDVNVVQDYELDNERKLKLALIQRLIKEGHCKYAQRLRNYKIIIVPLSVDRKNNETTTASMDSENAIIRIGEGFLNMVKDDDDEFVYRQLGVIIRHEMAHDLMKHQIRMAAKLKNDIGEDAYTGMLGLPTMHHFINIVADDEISNTRYTEEDKEIVRGMTLNGEVIGGLITEDHRAGWQDLTVEEMYDKLAEEADVLNQELIDYAKANGALTGEFLNDKTKDFLNAKILQAKALYARACDPEVAQDPAWKLKPSPKEYLQSEDFAKINDAFKPMIAGVINYYSEVSEDEVREAMYKLKDSSPFRVVLLANGKVKVASPEEKYIIGDILKNFITRKAPKKKKRPSGQVAGYVQLPPNSLTNLLPPQQGEEGEEGEEGENEEPVVAILDPHADPEQGDDSSQDDDEEEPSDNEQEQEPGDGKGKTKEQGGDHEEGQGQKKETGGDSGQSPEQGGDPSQEEPGGDPRQETKSGKKPGDGKDKQDDESIPDDGKSSRKGGGKAPEDDKDSKNKQDIGSGVSRGEVSKVYRDTYNNTRGSLMRDTSSIASRRDKIASILQRVGGKR